MTGRQWVSFLSKVRPRIERLLAEAGQTEPPIDIAKVARVVGVARIEAKPQPGNAIARTIMTPPGPVIQYDPAQPLTRRRFSIAHEIAHILLSVEGKIARPSWKTVDASLEGKCHQIARELLMPRDMFVQHVRTFRTPGLLAFLALASTFQVSCEALAYRLADFRLWPTIILFVQKSENVASYLAEPVRFIGSEQGPVLRVVRTFKPGRHSRRSVPPGTLVPFGSGCHVSFVCGVDTAGYEIFALKTLRGTFFVESSKLVKPERVLSLIHLVPPATMNPAWATSRTLFEPARHVCWR